MSVNFISTGNAPFDAWQDNFVTKVNLYKGGWGWSADANADWTLLTGTGNNKQARWVAAWAIVKTKEFLHSDEIELIKAHQSYESGDVKNMDDISIRIFIKRYIAFNKKVTDKQKAAMRMTVDDTVKTTTSISTEATGKLMPTYISVKHQIHLSIEFELTYPGTKSKKLQHGVKEAMGFILVQAASLTTIPDPAAKNSGYTYYGDFKRGKLTTNFTETQEGMAVLIYMQTKGKGKKTVLGNPTKLLRVVIS
ncbi:MAG: hypothetical protein ACYDCN_13520 [Bacteroidia bacterium]